MSEYASQTTGALIATDKVRGTSVYNLAGEKLGSIDDILLDKISGRATYAVLSFGGFLGLGTNHYPLPWVALQYSPELEGYLIDIDKDLLKNAPNYDPSAAFEWTPEFGAEIDTYYNDGRTRV